MQLEKSTDSIRYLLHLPQNLDTQESWPLILFLHGVGERGNDLSLVKLHGLARKVEAETDFPFIVVSPQCADDVRWTAYNQELINLVNIAEAEYPVDRQRVYLSGLSMGGQGAWHLAMQNPHRFAAAAPICGRRPPEHDFLTRIYELNHLPLWVFHGEDDDKVPIQESELMVEALQQCGGDVRFTRYPGVGHNSWDAAYGTDELYSWLRSHTRKPT